MDHVLARRDGLALVLALLLGSGAMCPKCGFGTRVTSKRWAKCKRCGERVLRRTMEDVGEGATRVRVEVMRNAAD